MKTLPTPAIVVTAFLDIANLRVTVIDAKTVLVSRKTQ